MQLRNPNYHWQRSIEFFKVDAEISQMIYSRSEKTRETNFFQLSKHELEESGAAVLRGQNFKLSEGGNLIALRTGDIAVLTESGVLLCGRSELIVKISGDIISPSLISWKEVLLWLLICSWQSSSIQACHWPLP